MALNILEKASLGQRQAMETLYENSKQTACFLARLLLEDGERAADAVIHAFDGIWQEDLERLHSEREFRLLVLRRTATWCKQKIQQQNPKAYRMPADRDFRVTEFGPITDSCLPHAEQVLNRLPEIHRLLFVLHTVGEYSTAELAVALKLDIKTTQMALESLPANCQAALDATGGQESYAEWQLYFRRASVDETVPQRADARVYDTIHDIAAPLERKKRRRLVTVSVVVALACALIAGVVLLAAMVAASNGGNGSSSVQTEPVIQLEDTLTYSADIAIQDYGTVTVELDAATAPVTVANFIHLAREGFYDGLTFHRIIEGFMMQGGDPEGNGTGGADKNIVGEFAQNGYDIDLSHTRGAISMARSNSFNSASSQFFIVQEDSTHLDGQYAVFGYVTQGMDIVDAVCEAAQPIDGNGTIPAKKQPVITSITIHTAEKEVSSD